MIYAWLLGALIVAVVVAAAGLFAFWSVGRETRRRLNHVPETRDELYD